MQNGCKLLPFFLQSRRENVEIQEGKHVLLYRFLRNYINFIVELYRLQNDPNAFVNLNCNVWRITVFYQCVL